MIRSTKVAYRIGFASGFTIADAMAALGQYSFETGPLKVHGRKNARMRSAFRAGHMECRELRIDLLKQS